MSITIGIDAGGTYTDAVVYDLSAREVLASGKALTTKEDLAVGINNVLDEMPAEQLRAASAVTLSTTLATNACVEDKGGRGKLLFIGVDRRAIEWVGDSYGLPPLEELRILPRPADAAGLEVSWKAFAKENGDWFRDADGIAVVDIDAAHNSAVYEKLITGRIEDAFGVPVICGHELSAELNSVRRGASTLLNVRLIPVIGAFLSAIRTSLKSRGIKAPVSIVRSDGSLMSESFTKVRPVETLLCGPAAGMIGGAHMTGEDNCLIVDMGGTTTDISVVRNGIPKEAEQGIQVGKWRTFVKGAFVRTVGLGGDSTIHLDKEHKPTLETRRALPLCMAAQRWPRVKIQLERLLAAHPKGHTLPLQDFFILLKSIDGDSRYTHTERALAAFLKDGPVGYREAIEGVGADVYAFKTERLEREGIILRCGLTPTDIMHIQGDFAQYDAEASRLGAAFLAAGAGMSPDALAGHIYEMVRKKLYRNIMEVLLEREVGPELEALLEESWQQARTGGREGLFGIHFDTPLTLVGIGAPTHIFLPEVAKVLSAGCVVPGNAGVANALGAAVSHVQTTFRVEVRPHKLADGTEGFYVYGPFEHFCSVDQALALENAVAQSERAAREEARRRGAQKAVQVKTEVVHRNCGTNYGMEIYLGSWAVTRVQETG